MNTPCPLSPWERVGVRAWAAPLNQPVDSTADALTPALSQGERESSRSQRPIPPLYRRIHFGGEIDNFSMPRTVTA